MPILRVQPALPSRELLYFNTANPDFYPIMSQTELLTTEQIHSFLPQAAQQGLCGTLSTLYQGKWNVFDVSLSSIDNSGLIFRILSPKNDDFPFKQHQPVGICLQQEHHKYIFETSIFAPGPSTLTLEWPEKIEKMQRRAYDRQPVPPGLNVKATFWHRGYINGTKQPPKENYWQGLLENLSAGGAMIRMDAQSADSFSMGQLIGLQFTPMSYQKPLLLEGHIRHLNTLSDGNIVLGIEFLGLEASVDGHTLLHRLLDVIDAYEKLNK